MEAISEMISFVLLIAFTVAVGASLFVWFSSSIKTKTTAVSSSSEALTSCIGADFRLSWDDTCQLQKGLIGWWKLDEGSGSVIHDSSGNGKEGTINGSTWTNGIIGDALSFDGVDDYAEINDTSGYPFTVVSWLNPFAENFVYSNSSWRYRRSILINNTLNPNNLTDYQVLVTLDTQSLILAGKMRSDCGDIHFTYSNSSGEYEIPYWIESGCNTTNTTIWVKVPYIPANGTTEIYM